jgi:hypothetical protein
MSTFSISEDCDSVCLYYFGSNIEDRSAARMSTFSIGEDCDSICLYYFGSNIEDRSAARMSTSPTRVVEGMRIYRFTS